MSSMRSRRMAAKRIASPTRKRFKRPQKQRIVFLSGEAQPLVLAPQDRRYAVIDLAS